MRENLSSKLKQNKAFTLQEMLVVIAITVILLGISILGIAELKENLKMSELDDYAKIIYLEAQDQLGIVEVEGALDAYHQDITSYAASAENLKGPRFLKELYTDQVKKYVPDYPISAVGQEMADKMWEHMCYLTKEDPLTTKMISHTSDIYNNGGEYVIEFNPKTGDVYGVFYWENDTEISYKDDIYNLTSRERSARKDKKIGYYGGALAGNLEAEKNLFENLTLVNGEELYLKISYEYTSELKADYSNLTFSVVITGEDDNTVTFNDIDLSSNAIVTRDTIDFYILLDSMYEGQRFNDIVNASKPEIEQVITPGENLTIKVTTSLTDASGSVINNTKTVQGNSLFANDTNESTIGITALRHMMNLNGTVYNADKFLNRNTIQYITDVDFDEKAYSWETDGSAENRAVYRGYGNAKRPMDYITPIYSDTLFKVASGENHTVTGKNAGTKYVLRNFVVEPADASGNPVNNVGIFGEVSNIGFSNIYVENIKVNKDGKACDNVGALIGYMVDGSITNCGVYLATSGIVNDAMTEYCMMPDSNGTCHDNEMAHRYDIYRIVGQNNVGGLVGKVEAKNGVNISKAFAAIKTEGKTSYVGGLIGYAYIPSGVATLTIEHSYASGDAIGQKYVGGFIGGVVSEGDNKVVVTDNYSTGNVYGNQKFGGFLGKTQKADYTKCISYGEIRKFGVAEGHGLVVGDSAAGFVYDSEDTNKDSSYKVDDENKPTCVYMEQIGYNRNATLKDPAAIGCKDYGELVSKNADTCVAIAYPYDAELYAQGFPFRKLDGQRTHYGDWAKKFVIDTSLVYYEKYADGDYGYYCVTTASGIDNIWLLDTLKEETCIEDGYGLLTKYNLESISYDLYIGNQGQDGDPNVPNVSGHKVPIKDRERAEGKIYTEEAFVNLNKQGSLTFEEVESFDAATGKVVQKSEEERDTFEVKGLYLYQLPYDLQCTNRRRVSYFYDRIVLSANAKGGTNRKVIDELAYLYCPHFAKTAYNPNVSSQPIDLTLTNPVPNPKNIFIRSARQLNALGRFSYYWNGRGGLENGEELNYIQETDINFSTYVKIYGGREFDLQDFGKEYSNHPIGVPDHSDTPAQFRNTYDGQSNKIIDYCVSTTNVQFTGLFGEIKGATLKNIVMLVSSDHSGNPSRDKVGKIISSFRTTSKNGTTKEMRAGVGALVGLAFENKPTQVSSNRIENCVVAGYTVQYELVKGNEANDLDPLGVAVGGLVGLSMSDISNCSVTNDVIINLKKDYSNTYPKNGNGDGVVYLGGAFGSHGYGEVKDCYSGGTIDVFSNGYRLPSLRVGGFCPGWLDTFPFYKSNTPYFATKKVVYENIYSYTEVSDRIHDEAESLYYIPLVSKIVEIFDKANTRSWIAEAIRNDGSVFTNNYYLEEVSLNHMENVEDTVVAYYQNVATGCSYDELVAMATNKADRTYLNGDLDADGNLIPYSKDYPYHEVIYDVNKFILDENREKVYTDYVHYGDWYEPFLPEAVLTYYEKYADGSYGYYCVTADKDGENAWVLDTLKDKGDEDYQPCIEDGYGLMTKYQLDSLSYKNWNAIDNWGADTYIQCDFEKQETDGALQFIGYQDYDEILGKGETSLGESVNASGLYTNLYKLPYDLQNRSKVGTFYDRIKFCATAGEAMVINELYCGYNPHFAKAALNLKNDDRYKTLCIPQKVFLRSARQLNALGRESYYWSMTGGEDNNKKATYIQETDINFSTYTKRYREEDFDLQDFTKGYRNRPIGTGGGQQFTNIYDGRGNAIIDYCVDGGTQFRYTGLFGEIQNATLKNIVMVVSTSKRGKGGEITTSFRPSNGDGTACVGLGALVGAAFKSGNIIENCAVSGYTVRYELKNVKDYDPSCVAVGGLVGFSRSPISNCTATNDVVMKLEKDYTQIMLTGKDGANDVANDTGNAYLGGLVGSQMYSPVNNCYSGGTIDVEGADNFKIPYLRVGGLCPGWLDIGKESNYDYNSYANDTKEKLQELEENSDEYFIVKYKNVYSYTKVSDRIWNPKSESVIYVPLVSNLVDYRVVQNSADNSIEAGEWITTAESKIDFEKDSNIYIEEVTAAHLEKAKSLIDKNQNFDPTKYYMNTAGENFTATRKSLMGLEKAADVKVTVIGDNTNTFINGDLDDNGNLVPFSEPYPYPAVIYKVVQDNGYETNEFVHYGDWIDYAKSIFVYYEKYEGDTYRYYGAMTDPNTDSTWVLDTLKDKGDKDYQPCIEDGYALLSTLDLDEITYDLYVANKGDAVSPQGEIEQVEVGGDLQYLYKLPFEQQFTSRTEGDGFYDRIVFNGRVDGKLVVDGLSCLYNPLFAKTALHEEEGTEYQDPTTIYIRSARQLNALGRSPYYWREVGGQYHNQEITYIQETDINFSTYVKEYMDQNFDLQSFDLEIFGKDYFNHVIGESYGTPFSNIYDGCSNKIIDYCLDGGDDTHFTGLFGEIKNATLKNIVMVVSSNKRSKNAGLITSSYRTHYYSQYNEESKITIRENRAGVGALLGMANTDSGYNTIDNCISSGYTVKYVLTDRRDKLQPLQTLLDQSREDIIEPLGIAVGGLIGYSTDNIKNCAAVNEVVIELHKDYQNTYDNYINRKGNNKSNDGTGGVVYLGGFVGSHYYGKIENCYSGGTINVIDKGYSIPKLRVGGFCPGWMDTPMSDNYYKHKSVKYVDIYSYTKVSENIWNVLGKKDWNKTDNVFEDTDEKTDTYYVPLVSGMVDYFKYDVRNQEYWLHDQSVLGTNTTFTNNYYLLELSATHLKHVLNDSSGKDVTASQVTVDTLKSKATESNKVTALTYANADTILNENYPYPAVITDVKTGKLVHYGPWYDGKVEGGLIKQYPTYFEEYEDGYGFWYVEEDGTIVENLTKDTSKVIKRAGYGYLTSSPEEAEAPNKANIDIKNPNDSAYTTYYLNELNENEIQIMLNGNDSQNPCQHFEMQYYKVPGGTGVGNEELVATKTLYMNPNFGAALSASDQLGKKGLPLQVRTKEQFQNVGIAGDARYHKQTHDVDLEGGHTSQKLESGSYYDGSSSDIGCVIKNAENTIFSGNDGNIENVRVVAFDSTDASVDMVGFISINNGTITNCSIRPANDEDEIVIQGKNAYGFVDTNHGIIEDCSIIGKVIATEGNAVGFANLNNGTIKYSFVVGEVEGTQVATGFVGKNAKTMEYCTVGNTDSNEGIIVKANNAYGFAEENGDQGNMNHCAAVGKVDGTQVAVGFVKLNTNTITNAAVYLADTDTTVAIHGEQAYGFAAINMNNGNLSNCKVISAEKGSVVGNNVAAGFVGTNSASVAESFVRALNSYEDIVIKGNDAYGFAEQNTNLIQECFVVGTVGVADTEDTATGTKRAAGFARLNSGTINICYSNANVIVSKKTTTGVESDNYGARAAGMVLTSSGKIEQSYAAGNVSGNMTFGFIGSITGGSTSTCYTIVNQAGTRMFGFAAIGKGTACYWGYDGYKNCNVAMAQKEYLNGGKNESKITGTKLSVMDNKADDTNAVPFRENLRNNKYPYATYGLTHYGDWPLASHFYQDMDGQDLLRAGLYYGEEYQDAVTGKWYYGAYAEGDYWGVEYVHKETGEKYYGKTAINDKYVANRKVRIIGATVNSLMKGDPEDIRESNGYRCYYGVYYNAEIAAPKWKVNWKFIENEQESAVGKPSPTGIYEELDTTVIPEAFQTYRFCELKDITEAVINGIDIREETTIFYKNATSNNTDTNYDDGKFFYENGNKVDNTNGVTLTITLDEVEAARNPKSVTEPESTTE